MMFGEDARLARQKAAAAYGLAWFGAKGRRHRYSLVR